MSYHSGKFVAPPVNPIKVAKKMCQSWVARAPEEARACRCNSRTASPV